MSNGTSVGKSHPVEKIVRLLIPLTLIWGGIKLFNAFAPTLITFFSNFWVLVGVGVPAIALVLYVAQNPKFLWMGYKTLCNKLTSFFIKLDPLSFMERYIDILNEKLKNLRVSKTTLEGKKVKLERLIDKLSGEVNDGMKKAMAAKKLGNEAVMNNEAYMASSTKQSVDLYTPILERMTNNLTFLSKLEENWDLSIQRLSHDVSRKREEYENLREMAKALGQAEEFANGDTEAGKIYQESVLALEDIVTQKIAYISEFEKKSKNIMGAIDIEKQMMNDEGMAMLEEYMKNDHLLLPESDWNSHINFTKKAESAKTTAGQSFLKID